MARPWGFVVSAGFGDIRQNPSIDACAVRRAFIRSARDIASSLYRPDRGGSSCVDGLRGKRRERSKIGLCDSGHFRFHVPVGV